MISASSFLTSPQAVLPFGLTQQTIADVFDMTWQTLLTAVIVTFVILMFASIDDIIASEKPTRMGRLFDGRAFSVSACVYGSMGVVLIFTVGFAWRVIDSLQRVGPTQILWTIGLSVVAFVIVLIVIAVIMVSVTARAQAKDKARKLEPVDTRNELDDAPRIHG